MSVDVSLSLVAGKSEDWASSREVGTIAEHHVDGISFIASDEFGLIRALDRIGSESSSIVKSTEEDRGLIGRNADRLVEELVVAKSVDANGIVSVRIQVRDSIGSKTVDGIIGRVDSGNVTVNDDFGFVGVARVPGKDSGIGGNGVDSDIERTVAGSLSMEGEARLAAMLVMSLKLVAVGSNADGVESVRGEATETDVVVGDSDGILDEFITDIVETDSIA